jgi:hypothetical protein
MENILKPSNEIVDDVNFHLTNILTDISKLKLEYNRDLTLIHWINNIKQKLETILELLLVSNSQTFIQLANEVNKLFVLDCEMSKVQVLIINHNRNRETCSTICIA